MTMITMINYLHFETMMDEIRIDNFLYHDARGFINVYDMNIYVGEVYLNLTNQFPELLK